MRPLLVIILNILLYDSVLFGQTIDDYYHQAAQAYIGGKYNQAIKAVEKGLELNPDDPKLNALNEKLKEKKNHQQQQPGEDQEKEDKEQQDQSEELQSEENQQQQQQAEEKEPQEMTKDEAERILEALKEDEKDLQKQRKSTKSGQVRIVKDW